jgi:hypothetical protein
MPVSFSHRRVGSSILASLSEAGGQRSAQIASKPFRLACNSGQLVYGYAPTSSYRHGALQPRIRLPIFIKGSFSIRYPTRGSSTFITRVMSLFGSNDLSVFFCFRLKLSSYEALFYSPPLSSGSLALRRVARSHRGGLCFRARRHFRTSPSNQSGGLLLWLCTVENVGRLHQNVRAAQVRLALVGRHLCKGAHDHSHRKVRRRPQAAASRPRGARLKSIILEARK